MLIPSYVKTAVEVLSQKGFKAYAVGGCVRDNILGKAPHDWDLTTDASPEEICKAFREFHVIETGLKHGTVTVRIEHNSVEITTFRSDGEYKDHRRPEAVAFVKNLSEDLSRRDFTANALAFNESEGIVDLFGGMDDIKNKIIRCVGNPEKRFGEDALRILRALRFASCLDFEIEAETSAAIHRMKGLLNEISCERIREELLKLICGEGVFRVLSEYSDVVAQIIPEISECFGFSQKNPHHMYDVYTHIIKSVSYVEPTDRLRLVMLLHDIAKPFCYTEDERGTGHFYGHPAKSAEAARGILNRLKFDNKTKDYVIKQIEQHDNRFSSDRKSVRRFVSKHGFEFFYDHIKIRRADILAQSDYGRDKKLEDLKIKEKIAEELEREGAGLTLKELAVNGRDLIDCGFCQGKELKEVLNRLLEAVVDEKVENEKSSLLSYAESRLSNLKSVARGETGD